MKEQTAWLIERRDIGQPHWLAYSQGVWSWTNEASDATKFADEKSAQNIAYAHREVFPIYVCEHSWPEGLGKSMTKIRRPVLNSI